MQCRALFNIACALILEGEESGATALFETCSVGIINSFLCENRERAILLGASGESIPCVSELDVLFPYPDRLISPCIYYLASRLVRDENAASAEELMERCDRLLASLDKQPDGESGAGSSGSDVGSGSAGDAAGGDATLEVYPGSIVDVYAGVN